MRKLISTLFTICISTITFSQVTVFNEDFESPPGNVTSSGSPGWAINSRLQTSGVNSDSSFIDVAGSISYLETGPFDCSGNFYVTLTFNGICKVEFFDGGTIEYSIDQGATWHQLIDNDLNPGGNNNCNYLGSGLFRTQGSKFQEASYAAWQPGTAVFPVNSWWQAETFDISQVAGNQPDVRLRFKLADGNNNGGIGRAGWYVDDINVVAAVCELVAPVLTQLAPFYPSTIYNLGPFIVNIDATDLSGFNSVTLNYTVNGNAQTPISMTNSSGSTYTASIPAVTAGDVVCYYVEAIDASGCDNTSYLPGPTSSQTVCFTAQDGVTFPYCDFFDVPSIPWTTTNAAGSTWQSGTPAFGATNSAYSAPNSWDVNLTSAYGNNANSVLMSPEMSFTVGAGAKVEFYMNYNVEQTWDGTRMEWATNVNGPWTLLGSVGCANCTNWYNSAAITSSGLPGWTGNSGGWAYRSIELDASFNNQPQVWFRFVFTSDGSITGDGVSIDNFCISLPQPDDVGVTTITQPGPIGAAGNCVPVIVIVKNNGINTQTNFPVTATLNPGGITVSGSYSGSLTPGATASVTLPCVVIPTGNYTICAYTGLTGDGNHLNDTICGPGTGIPTIPVSYSQQFFDNFDGTNNGWTATNTTTGSQWQLGTPAFGSTNSAQSPPTCWDVNLTTAYGNNANCTLTSPLFDFSNAVDATLSFWRNNTVETGWDGTRLEYSMNGGAWTLLGGANMTAPCWVNWYNSTPNINSSNLPAWTGVSGGWVKTEANCLSMFNNASTVQFRFVFTSDASVTQDGASIDNFRITIPIPVSAAPLTVNTSAINNSFIFPGQSVQFSSPISNQGTTPLTSVVVTLTIDGVPYTTDTVTYSPALPSGQNLLHTFGLPWNASPGVYTVCAITSYPNNGPDLNPVDDTTCITISVFDTVTVTSANPYCNDFESGPQWVSVNALTYNSMLNSWQIGTPAQTIINGAYSGSNAWMTNLSANYPNRDTSGLFTPVFAIDPSKCYRVSFWHKFDTEPYADGGILEYSTDNALTWQHLGFYSAATSNIWFNTPFVTALGGSPGFPGWTGTQSTWTKAEHDINFWNNGNVIFRFRFASDNTVNNHEGWAIDDFCFEEIAQPCITGIADPVSSLLVLEQNQPNPFNHSTTINYSIPTDGLAKISIVNVVGQVVAVPVNGNEIAGQHNITLSSDVLRPGIYYYTLEFENQKLTRKMVITK